MKYLMFKNESGDDAFAICLIDDISIEDSVLEEIVNKNVGDDFDGEDLYGTWWIEDFTETKLTDLLGERNVL